MVSAGRWPAALAATAATTVAITALVVWTWLAPLSPRGQSDGPFAVSWLAVPVVVLLVTSCWLMVDDQPASAVGLSVMAAAWLLPALAGWPQLNAQVRAGLLAATPLAAAGIALVTGRWRPPPDGGRLWLCAAVGLASAGAVVHLLGYDPFLDPACQWTCLAAPTPLSRVLPVRQTLELSATLTLAASMAALLVSMRGKAVPAGLRAAASCAAVAAAVTAVVPLWSWGGTRMWVGENLLPSLGAGAVALAALSAALHTRMVRRSVRDLVTHLTGSAMLSGASAAVTAVHFAVPGDGRWVDSGGDVVTTGEPSHYTVLSDRDGPTVRLVLGRRAEPVEALSVVTPAARLALENARLSAVVRRRLADVAASQRRIVETTDLERRRIERDLHDGAQQRLVAVCMHLSARRDRSEPADTLTAAESNVRQALAALRDLSDYSVPAVLGAEGLQAAIEDLAATTPIAVDIHIGAAAQHVAPAVQTAVYLMVAAGLDNVITHASTDSARITLGIDHEILSVTVSDGGRGGASMGPGLTDVADRIGALGGTLTLTGGGDRGTTICVRIPCES